MISLEEIFAELQENVGVNPLTISCERKNRFRENDYWTVSGLDVQAGGYTTLLEAFDAWMRARKRNP